MSDRLVSVIMPSYNGAKHLADSIDSILSQTYKHLELLITDDHSDDEQTLGILQHYSEQDSRVNVLYLDSNHGPGYARNKSIERAKGRYIAFCDSDDRWFPEKLEKQIAFMDKYDSALCFASYIICDEHDQEQGIVIAPDVLTFGQLKRDNKIGCLTAIYDIEKLGHKYYMPAIRKRQDWGLFLAILRDCREVRALREPLAYYRDRKGSVSSRKFGLIKYNILIYQKVLGFSPLKSHLYFYFLFAPTYLLKRVKKRIDSIIYLNKKKSTYFII
jgi:glycosyltransferase involved in cell wall biosynthesis